MNLFMSLRGKVFVSIVHLIFEISFERNAVGFDVIFQVGINWKHGKLIGT